MMFAVAPATGVRKGMLIWAVGGLGRSTPLECKNAFAKYFPQYLNENDSTGKEGYDTPEEQQAAQQNATAFFSRVTVAPIIISRISW